MGTGVIVLIVVLVLLVPMLGIFAVLSVYGVRKYIANAKTAEARSTVAQIAKSAVRAYENESADGTRRLCASASQPVPADRKLVSARKYQSSSEDWQRDATANAGFACLRFSMPTAQYFQYVYEASATGFVVRAHGDLNGDGEFSTFEIKGEVQGDQVVVSPTILEKNPDE